MKKKVKDVKDVKNKSYKIKLITKVIFFIVFILLILFILIDFNYFDHYLKGSINNIFDIKVESNDNFILVGDSITERYPIDELYEGLPVVNSGVGGYTTSDVLRTLDEKVYKYNPTKVFLLIGINDLKQEKSVDDIFNNIIKIISKINKNRPAAKVYVQSIYPINNSDDEKVNPTSIEHRSNKDINKINNRLKEYYKDTDVTYIDINKSLLDKKNMLKLEYTEDGVHLTALGYIKVTKVLLPYLND